MTKVSVIIPTYNRSNLVRECIDSVLKQSFADFELLVIDDGSTDDTASVIQKISDTRLEYVYKENAGPSSARNLALVRAQGQYIAFLDSDDLWPENFLEVMVSNLENNPDYGAAYSLFKKFCSDGTVKEVVKQDRFVSGWHTLHYYRKHPPILPSTVVFRECVWKGFWWDEALTGCEDHDVFLRLSTTTKFLFVADTCVQRRRTPDSVGCASKLSLNAMLVLERFYFRLGGDKYVPWKVATRKLARMYRQMGRKHYQAGCRCAAISLLKKALHYYRADPQAYRWLLKALLLRKHNDVMPGWQPPKPLSPYITVAQKMLKSPVGLSHGKSKTDIFS